MPIRSESLYRGQAMDPYASHTLFYDILDLAVFLRMETLRLSKLIDESYTLTNAQQGLLGMIYRYEGATQAELARLYKRDPKNLINAVAELKKRGLVRLEARGEKEKPVYLTEEGHGVNNKLMAARGKLIDKLLESVSEAQLIEVRAVLEQLSDALYKEVSSLEKSE